MNASDRPRRSEGPLRVHVGPRPDELLSAAVQRGGGVLAGPEEAEMIVWSDFDPEALRPLLGPGVRWVQLPSAGVESWLESGLIDAGRTWMSAADAHSEPVAEQALALILAARRRLPEALRARRWDRSLAGRPLRGATVAIVGAGGIGRALIALLEPHGVEVVAVTRRGLPVPGAGRTLPAARLGEAWPLADAVVIAAPATAATRHLVDAAALAAMREDAWLVNVARGSLVDTEALVAALDAGSIGGAALDVTEPEPLPEGHPLWGHPRAIITPHVANPPSHWTIGLAARAEQNVRRIAAGCEPLAAIDPRRGY